MWLKYDEEVFVRMGSFERSQCHLDLGRMMAVVAHESIASWGLTDDLHTSPCTCIGIERREYELVWELEEMSCDIGEPSIL